MNDKTELEKLVSFLDVNSKFLQEHPSCSYIIPMTLAKLEENGTNESLEESVNNFKDHLECVWNDVTSAISTIVPVSLQLEIIRKIGELIQGFAKLIREHHSPSGSYSSLDESVDHLKEEWEKSCKNLVTRVQTAVCEYRRPLGKLYKRDIKERSDKNWKNDFIRLINTYDLMNESKQPSYLLKSGYRSFFFFSSADLTSPTIWSEFCKILSAFMEKEVDPFIAEKLRKDETRFKHVLQRYSQFGLKNTIELAPVAKMHGENLGTPTLMAGLANLGFSQRDLAPSSYFGIERLRGRKPEEDMLIVMLDDVSSRGAGIGESIERLGTAIGQKPFLGLLIVDRSREEISESHGLGLLSMIDRSDLVESRIWEPEILLASFEDPLWSGINLTTDTIEEACKFAAESTKKHEDLRNGFSLLLEDVLKIETDHGKTKILGTRIEFAKDDLEMYLSNFLIICWNMLIPASFRIDEPVKFLDLVLELERNHRIALDPCALLLQQKLDRSIEDESSFLKEDDIIHRLLVSHNDRLVHEIKNKYNEYLKLTMGKAFELYSEKELNDMVDETIKKTRERFMREGRMEKFNKYEKDFRDELLEAYRCFNVAFGKQPSSSPTSDSR